MIRLILVMFLTILMGCEVSFDPFSMVDPEVINIYPPDDSTYPENDIKTIPINSAIVVRFNKSIDNNRFRNDMITIKAVDGPVINYEHDLLDDTIVITPEEMIPDSPHTVTISGVIDTDGNVLQKPYASSFKTKLKADTTPPSPIKVKMTENIVEVIFDEPLLAYNLADDAIALFDISNGSDEGIPITGRIKHTIDTNQIYFIPDRSLDTNIRYKVIVYGKKGITDLALNEFVTSEKPFYVYPAPATDSSPPYIDRIETHYESKTFTIHFSERIDSFNLLEDKFNIPDYLTQPAVDKVFKGIRMLRFFAGPGWFGLDISVDLTEDHKGLTIDRVGGLEDPDFKGYPFRIIVLKDAILDLKGNKLVHNNDPDFIETDEYIEFTWVVPGDY